MAYLRMWSAMCMLVILLTIESFSRVSGVSQGADRRAGRKRSGSSASAGMAAFRSESTLAAPVDPLFTDQREIRLSFPKDRLWPEGRGTSRRKSTKKTPKSNGAKQDTYPRKGLSRKPNIVLFLTDDQDIELGSLDFMPKTRSILKDGGAFFPNSFVSTPMCCPSRSTLLTGLFVHNHGVLTNNDNCSSAYWQAEHEPRSFGAYLASAGYRTGYFGKYLNKYNGSYIPPGWREWAGLVMNSRYYNYTINFNGQKIKHGFDYHSDYYPDLITNDSISFIRQSKKQFDQQPFLLVMSFPSPHGPEDSAPQYADKFFNVTRHRTPSYDFAPNPDKQWILRWLGKMKPVHQRFTDLLMTKRLQTLQSVDDSVQRIYRELVATGQLDNTYMFYTSDHGYHLGQFGLIKGKSFPFEFDIRVPFLVRGPGIGHGRVVHSLVGNVDIAPTFLEIAGLPVPSHMDGASIFRFFQKKTKNRTPWRDTYLIERGKIPPANMPKLNVIEDVPQSNEGAEGDDGDGVSVEYSTPRGKFERLAVECQKPQYQSPCTGFQKYECVFVSDRWKMKRCRITSTLTTARKVRKWCKCKALSKYRLSKLEPEERRMQRAFLKEHTSVDWRVNKPRFLKTVAGKSGRHKRKAQPAGGVESASEALTDGSVLREVAEDELEQVELLMEDISDEIFDLEAMRLREKANVSSITESSTVVKVTTSTADPISDSANSGGRDDRLNCQFYGKNRINCSSEIYSDPVQWRLSREYLDQQIRILRVQLDEMKVIRKHLREMRPFSEHRAGELGFVTTSPPQFTSFSSRRVKTSTTTTTEHSQAASSGGQLEGLRNPYVDSSVNQDTLLPGKRRPPFDKPLKPNRAGRVQVNHVFHNGPDDMKPDEAGRHGLCRCDVNWSRSQSRGADREIRQAARRKIKEERLRRKHKKQSRKAALSAMHNGQCNYEKMNCFSHDNNHWRTSPVWTDGPFCVCMNANNNTYWCIRTLNSSHNSLYCEFITGFVTYYDMRIDPFQLRNIAHTLTESQLAFFHQTLERMRVCKGADCFINTSPETTPSTTRPASSVRHDPLRGSNAYHLQSSQSPDNRSSSTKLKPKRDRFWRRHKRREEDKTSSESHQSEQQGTPMAFRD